MKENREERRSERKSKEILDERQEGKRGRKECLYITGGQFIYLWMLSLIYTILHRMIG
jgi:hypothetical protein